ncbi:hypothetical protein ACHAXR_011633 [Thalassiosira sp. AJA248-18]
MASSAVLSQELFDETILENEDCFDLTPDDALRETIDQFCQQLGVDVVVIGSNSGTNAGNDDDNNNGGASVAAPLQSPTSVAIANNTSGRTTNNVAPDAVVEEAVVVVPAELSHLVLSHPNSSEGQRDRESRREFQNCLTLLDGCVNTDGTVNVTAADGNHADGDAGSGSGRVLNALVEIGRRCRFGSDFNFSENDKSNNKNSTSPLPYLATFQRTSSIYTLMNFLNILDPTQLLPDDDNSGDDETTATNFNLLLSNDNDNNPTLQILSATAHTLSSILVNNPSRDDGKCLQLRVELRDIFVPALGRLVCLIGGLIKTITASSQQQKQHDNDAAVIAESPSPAAAAAALISLLCVLFQLGTNATRGCESAKVAWVQSTLPPKFNTSNNKRGGVAVVVSCLSLANNDDDAFNDKNIQLLTEACQLLASLCRYDDFRGPSSTGGGGGGAPVTSSAHDHAMEFHRAGTAMFLIKIARGVLSSLLDDDDDDDNGYDDSLEEEFRGTPSDNESGKVANERLAAAVLTALRVLAVNDEIIQTMVALGVLPIVTRALQHGVVTVAETESGENAKSIGYGTSASLQSSGTTGGHYARKQRLAAASLGLLRNLCGNDEIKTNLCLGSSTTTTTTADQRGSKNSFTSSSILPHLLRAMQSFPSTTLIQEHACGTLAAMALRRPANARAILDAEGPRLVLLAMKRHPENVNVQRQGALAVRNIVSRLLRDLPEGGTTASSSASNNNDATAVNGNNNDDNDERTFIRDVFLELGAEDTLRNIAGRHQGSVDEAYAALRDLGCTVSLVKFNADDLQQSQQHQQGLGGGRTMMFGEKHNSNFRPVYEESVGLSDGVDSAISQFGA